MTAPVCRACDRVEVEIVLASGMVLPDYGFDRPVPTKAPSELAPDAEWILTPGACSRLEGSRLIVSFDLLPDDVSMEGGRISVVRVRRYITVEFDETALMRLVDELCVGFTLARSIDVLPLPLRDAARILVMDMVGWKAVVASTGARSRVAHEWSMRGARARGRVSPSEIAAITFGSRAQDRDGAAIVDLAAPRVFPIDSLSKVLRQRRSPTRYDSSPISLDHLGQLLGAACGITGELAMGEHRLGLRAYPSPGALYAVDAYVIPARVEGLADGVFRYDPERHALVMMHDRRIDPASFCLPDTRTVVGGIAAFIALSIDLPRATWKYGDESYRILVAEAGCIAENLILVAHALGLRAGPFTGVFDRLVDQAIGGHEEVRFVVGVLIGQAGSQS